MTKYQNNEVLTNVMNSYFYVISTRTTMAHAWLTIKKVLQKIQYNYDFVRFIEVIDLEDVKEIEYYNKKKNIVDITSDFINNLNPKQIGLMIQSFSDTLEKSLGPQAGYHLLREFRDELGKDYYDVIKDMGVNLRLTELQEEIYKWSNAYEGLWNK